MSYTLLYTRRDELRHQSAPCWIGALSRARGLLDAGAEQISVLDPYGREVATHEDIVRHRNLVRKAGGAD
jgi:hypothetical protein